MGKSFDENLTVEELEEIGKAEARRYRAEWRKKNKDKIRATNARYWAKRAILRKRAEDEAGGAANE